MRQFYVLLFAWLVLVPPLATADVLSVAKKGKNSDVETYYGKIGEFGDSKLQFWLFGDKNQSRSWDVNKWVVVVRIDDQLAKPEPPKTRITVPVTPWAVPGVSEGATAPRVAQKVRVNLKSCRDRGADRVWFKGPIEPWNDSGRVLSIQGGKMAFQHAGHKVKEYVLDENVNDVAFGLCKSAD